MTPKMIYRKIQQRHTTSIDLTQRAVYIAFMRLINFNIEIFDNYVNQYKGVKYYDEQKGLLCYFA